MAVKTNNEFFFNPSNDSRNTQYKATAVINGHLRAHNDQWNELPSQTEFINSLGDVSRRVWPRTRLAFVSSLFGHVFDCNPYKGQFLYLPQDDLSIKRMRKMLDYVIDNRKYCLYREACYDPDVQNQNEWFHNMEINPYWVLVAGCRYIMTLDAAQLLSLKWEGLNKFTVKSDNVKYDVVVHRVNNLPSYKDV